MKEDLSVVLRPEDIEQREFGSALRGFDKHEVRAFLRRVAGEVRYLESEIQSAGEATMGRPTAPGSVPVDGSVAPVPADRFGESVPPMPPAEAATGGAETAPLELDLDRFGAIGDRIAALLRSAQETAEQLRVEAHHDADVIRAEADEYADATRSDADAEAERLRSVASAELEAAHTDARSIREAAARDAAEMRSLSSSELQTARAESEALRAAADAEAETARERAVAEGLASLSSRESAIAAQEAEVSAEREKAMAELSDARAQVATLLQEARAQSEFIRQESEEIIRTKVRANMEQAQRRIDMLRTTETASKDRIAAARRELERALARLESEPAPTLAEGLEHEVLQEAQQRVVEIDQPLSPTDSVPGVGTGDIVDVDLAEESWPEAESGFGAEAQSGEESRFDEVADPGYDAVDGDEDPLAGLLPPTESAAIRRIEPPMPPSFAASSFGFEPVEPLVPAQSPAEPSAEPPAEARATETGPAETAEPLGDSADDDAALGAPVADIQTPENEDALAKLVREAMQRAVDSARANEA